MRFQCNINCTISVFPISYVLCVESQYALSNVEWIIVGVPMVQLVFYGNLKILQVVFVNNLISTNQGSNNDNCKNW